MSKLLFLREAIEHSWDEDTSYCPDKWTPTNPSLGQCAVTALIVHKFSNLPTALIRGEIQTAHGNRETHYWDEYEGVPIDWTWQQFPLGSSILDYQEVDPTKLFLDGWFSKRYTILEDRVIKYLKDHGY